MLDGMVFGEAVGVVSFVTFSFSLAFIVYKLTEGSFPLEHKCDIGFSLDNPLSCL